MCKLRLNEKWSLLLISIHHHQMRHGVNSTGLKWVNTRPLSFTSLLLACLLGNHQVSQTGTMNQATIVGLWIYLVCAPCRCSRIRGRSPGKVEADPVPCVAFYPCPVSGTTPGHWESSAHTWSPPGDVHIRCCWWRRSAWNKKRRFKKTSTGAGLWVRVRLAESFGVLQICSPLAC